MKRAFCLFVISGIIPLFATFALADTIVKPNTFTAGTPANAEQVNANFDTVYDQVNKLGGVITVDGAKNVGIGTATPVGELHVTKPQVVSGVTFTGTGLNDITVDTGAYVGTGSTAYMVRVNNPGPTPNLIEFSSNGGATWSALTAMVSSGLNIGSGVTIGFAALGGHTFGDQWEWTVSQGFPDGLIVSDGKVTVKKIAITGGATAGRVLTSDATGNATWQTTAPDADNDSANELNQALDFSKGILEITDKGGALSVDLSSLVDDADADPINEIQTLSQAGTNVTLSRGGGTISVADNDNSTTNELNASVTITGTTLNVNDGGGTKFVDLAERLGLDNLTDAIYDDGVGYSLFLGNSAGIANTIGAFNTAVGVSSLYRNTTGNYNTVIGSEAFSNNTTGSYNVTIGSLADKNNQTGANNTIIGYQAGQGSGLHSKSGNVFLGYQAGYNEIGSDKLYIDNSNTTLPLIYGDFAANALTVNGTLTTTGNSTINGTLTTTSSATVGGTMSVANSLSVSGNSSIGSGSPWVSATLSVKGDAQASYTGFFENTTNGPATCLYGRAFGETDRVVGNSHYGVRGEAYGGYANFGLTGITSDASATFNYGVYGSASGGTINYAGYFAGNVFVTDDVSAVTFTDRTPYPKDLATAYAAVLSMHRLPDGEYDENDKEHQLDHSTLHEFVRSADGEYRDLSATVSAQNEVIKDLIKKNDALKLLVCQDHPEAGICQ